MKPTTRNHSSYLLCVAGVTLFLCSTARAELDYEYGKSLLEAGDELETEELVTRLVGKLEQSPQLDQRLDGVLLKARLLRKQAAKSSATKGQELLDQASEAYKAFQSQGKSHRLLTVCETEASTVSKERIKLLLKAAKETPEKAKELRAQAGSSMSQVATACKAEAEKLYPAFQAAYKKLTDWQNVDANVDKAVPRDILVPLDQAFNEWIVAERKYISARVDQIDCLDETDPEKEKIATEVAKLCEAHIADESISGFPLLEAWFFLIQGHSYASIKKEAEATEAWRNALAVQFDNPTNDQKKQLASVKKTIIFDLVSMKMSLKKYSDVALIITECFDVPENKAIFSDDEGKELLIKYATAITLQTDATASTYMKGISIIEDAASKEPLNSRYKDRFALTSAEIVTVAKKSKIRLSLSAKGWLSAGHGVYLQANNSLQRHNETEDSNKKEKQSFKAKYKQQFLFAAECLKNSIAASRDSKQTLVDLLTIEPQAWLELGLCYHRLEDYLEEIIVLKHILETYGKEPRAKWMGNSYSPDKAAPNLKAAVSAAEKALDLPNDGILAKAQRILILAIDSNLRISGKNVSTWNRMLKGRILEESDIKIDEDIEDNNYLAAMNKAEDAKNRTETSKMESDVAAKVAGLSGAATVYKESLAQFEKVKETSPAYELALYQQGSVFTSLYELNQILIQASADKQKSAPFIAESEDARQKAIDKYAHYRSWIAKHEAGSEQISAQRTKLLGVTYLALSKFYLGAKQFDKCIECANEALKLHSEGKLTAKSAQFVLANKFNALISKAESTDRAVAESALTECEQVMSALQELNPGDRKQRVSMLNSLTRKYLAMADQETAKSPGSESEKKFEMKAVGFQEERMKLLQADSKEQLSLNEYTRMLALFIKTKQTERAVEWGTSLLAAFDPENKNSKLNYSPTEWQAVLEIMKKIIKSESFETMQMARSDHAALVDFMYDTREGIVSRQNKQKGPPNDKYAENMDKATDTIQTIKNNYPKIATLDPKMGIDGQSYIELIESEINFRRKLMATRDTVMDLSLKCAATLSLDKANAEEAQRFREIANKQLKILMEVRGATPEMETKSALLDLANGNADQAADAFRNILMNMGDDESGSVRYFDARRGLSEAYALQSKWSEAANFPEYLVLTAGIDAPLIQSRWPELGEFLANCYKNGAKKNAKAQELLEKRNSGKKEGGEQPVKKEPENKTVQP